MDGSRKPMIGMLGGDFGQGGSRDEPDAVVKVDSGIMIPVIDSDNCRSWRYGDTLDDQILDSLQVSVATRNSVDVGDYGRNIQSTFS
jgi:hypothetical protein